MNTEYRKGLLAVCERTRTLLCSTASIYQVIGDARNTSEVLRAAIHTTHNIGWIEQMRCDCDLNYIFPHVMNHAREAQTAYARANARLLEAQRRLTEAQSGALSAHPTLLLQMDALEAFRPKDDADLDEEDKS